MKALILNAVYLKNRIAELGLKQWWLAEQVGVDRKTVVRWVNGQVKALQSENAQALTEILRCTLTDLTLVDASAALATPQDQKIAARLLASNSLLATLGPIGEWALAEALLKATLVPDLPLHILGELYNQLAVASWRQGKIEEAELYTRKAAEFGERSGDKRGRAQAYLSEGNLASWRGKTRSAIVAYESALALATHLDPQILGSIWSNLGAVYFEAGDLEAAERLQRRALEALLLAGHPMNVSIAWAQLAMIFLERGETVEAHHATEKSLACAQAVDYRRGLAFGQLLAAEGLARARSASAIHRLRDALDDFAQLGIEEGLNFEIAGRAMRCLGVLAESERYLRQGLAKVGDFPVYRAALCRELAVTLAAAGDRVAEAHRYAEEASELYRLCEAPLREAAARQLCSQIGDLRDGT